MACCAVLTVKLPASHRVELVNGDQIRLRNHVLPAPLRRRSDRLPLGQPGDVGGDRKQLRAVIRRGFAVHAAKETATDAVLQAEEPTLPTAWLREGSGDTRIRQGAEALPGVQVAVVARHAARHQAAGLAGRIHEDAVAPLDFLQQLGVGGPGIPERVLRDVPRRHHRHACRHQRPVQGVPRHTGSDFPGRSGAPTGRGTHEKGQSDGADMRHGRTVSTHASVNNVRPQRRTSRRGYS